MQKGSSTEIKDGVTVVISLFFKVVCLNECKVNLFASYG